MGTSGSAVKARGLAALMALLFLIGCLRPITIPLETIRYSTASPEYPRFLIVFLPGNGDPVTVFQNRSLIDAVVRQGYPADMIAVDAHLGYYLNNSFTARLKTDVIDPARKQGYHRIWLVGNSLGGYGSFLYAKEHPEDIAGMVALGPYLGDAKIVEEIRRAGGIERWEPPAVREKNANDWARDLWAWVKGRLRNDPDHAWGGSCRETQSCGPVFYLGYGMSDRFSSGQQYLGSLMPAGQVIAVDGGHDWHTWKRLWDLFLDRDIFSY